MKIFAVVFTHPDPSPENPLHAEAAACVRDQFPEAYQLNERTFLVRSNRLSNQVAESVEIKSQDRRFSGAVLRIHPEHYAGFTSKDLWEWLDETDTP